MEIISTQIEDLYIIKPRIFKDDRGYFFESYNKATFDQKGLSYTFVQDNQSQSKYGTLRGLHFQTGNHAQAKLVRVIKGAVLDVAVDIRKDSSTFGQHVAVELSEENQTQFLIPRGFAHGFVTLSDTAIFSYKCDNYYNKEAGGHIIYNDPDLNIDWKIPQDEILLSNKDSKGPQLKDTTCL